MISSIQNNSTAISMSLDAPETSAVVINGHKMPRVVIYQNQLAQIEDDFTLNSSPSLQHIEYSPILSKADKNSHFLYLDSQEAQIISQHVEDNPLTVEQQLKELIGQKIQYVSSNGIFSGGGVLIEVGEKTVTLFDEAEGSMNLISKSMINALAWGDKKKTLVQKPTFKATLQTMDSTSPINAKMIALNRGLSWAAKHRLVLEELDSKLVGKWYSDIQVTNQNNTDLKKAHVCVVSGDLNAQGPRLYNQMPQLAACKSMESASNAAIDQKWDDLKAYLIPFRIDLKANQTISTPLFTPQKIELDKRYIIHSTAYESSSKNASVCYYIENNVENGLGKAFPNGEVQIYQKNVGAINLIGISTLQKTPNGKDLEITASKSFDVMSKRTAQTTVIKNFLGQTTAHEINVKIALTNASDDDKEIYLHEHLPNGCKILSSSLAFHKDLGDEKIFKVLIPKNTFEKNPVEVELKVLKNIC